MEKLCPFLLRMRYFADALKKLAGKIFKRINECMSIAVNYRSGDCFRLPVGSRQAVAHIATEVQAVMVLEQIKRNAAAWLIH
ncbi:hypothetical protein PSP6_150027 [Paraburkholderia tropica]|nr:hypothetical protein PSP6_150027 [Paraburkholderia tropica]